MKRILLSLVFCSPLLFSAPFAQSVELVGPVDESVSSEQQYGPISSSETLWGLSNKLRPDNSVSVYQTLVAIYKLNPYAFYKGDINSIIPQSILNVPSLAFISEQTNKEAYRLLKPVKKPTSAAKAAKKASQKKKQQSKELALLKATNAELVSTLQSDLDNEKKALASAQELIAKQEKELSLINEQLLSAIEMNQNLKLKLQPLSEQVNALSDQVKSEISIQDELQALIDQYRVQIAAFVEPPYSGEGGLNAFLRTITSSLTNLLLAIFLPLLLFLAITMVILRIKSKQAIVMEEQELAESISTLMEKSGKFDSLLSDDLDNQYDHADEIDFTQELPSQASEVNTPENDVDSGNLDGVDSSQSEAFDAMIEGDQDTLELDMLFEEDALIAEPDNDVVLDNDDFDIDTLFSEKEEAIELSDIDSSLASDSQQADLDLAAQWESQLAAEVLAAEGDSLIIESSAAALDIADIESSLVPDSQQADLDLAAQWESQLAAEVLAAEADNSVIDSNDAALEVADIESVLDINVIDDLIDTTETVEMDYLINANEESIEAALTSAESTIIEDLHVESNSDLSEFENVDISTLKSVDEYILELDSDSLSPNLQVEDEAALNDPDLLAKQLSSVAFEDTLTLPKVDKTKDSEFIDINTLLEESSHSVDVSEDEFNLEFGLDEFPDVVSSFSEFDSDDNGVAAQLDLARAYLEIDDKKSAKEILVSLSDKAKDENLKEVEKLLNRIN